MTTLEYLGLTLHAGAARIVDDVSLAVEGPGVFALLGPSGVGKSSLLRATQRLIDHGRGGWRREGDVRFNGESIFGGGLHKQELARRIGFVQQRPRVLGGSVRGNVEFALRHTTRLGRREIRRRAAAALERVDLARELESLDAAAWKLSGGQIQRLAIARAIALDPEALLMDEPIAALDPLSAERVEEVIREIAADRLVVLVTHKVGLAVRLAGTAGFMMRGPRGARLVEVGRAPEIFESPADPVAREFVRMGYGDIGRAEGRRRRRPYAAGRPPASTPRPAAVPGLVRRPLRRLYLFICGHNTSRSPVAQAICNGEIARRLGVEAAAGVAAESAGLAAPAGRPMTEAARNALAELGYAPHEHATRTVSADLVERADAVFCMTDAQCRALAELFPAAERKIERLDPVSDVEDPDGRQPELFLATMKRIRDAVRWRLANDLAAATSEA